MGLSPERPAAVYAMHHPGFGAVQVGVCSEPRQRRIRQHERHGWSLLADLAVPTARDGEAIERAVLDTCALRVWDAVGFGAFTIEGLPGHGTFGGCSHCRTPRAKPHLRIVQTSFLTAEQMPQRGHTETFDARLVSPGRIQLALYFAEAAHRSLRYPDRDDDLNPFDVRRDQVARAVERDRWSRPIRC